MSNSVRPHRGQPTRLPRPWDSPGKNTGVGCHFLLQCMKVKVKSLSPVRLSPVRLLSTPWTAAYQAPPSMGFARQEYWSWVPLPSHKRTEIHPNSFIPLSRAKWQDIHTWTFETGTYLSLQSLKKIDKLTVTLAPAALFWVNMHFFFFFLRTQILFFFLIGLCRVLVATRGIFQLRHAGSSSLTRAPCAGSAVWTPGRLNHQWSLEDTKSLWLML